MAIKLGKNYRDELTGFEGRAVCRSEWENGCIRVTLERGDKDNKVEAEGFDEQRLVPPEKVKATAGGPRSGDTHVWDGLGTSGISRRPAPPSPR